MCIRDRPVIIHTITKKGKGYINAEKDPGKFHGIGPFDTTTGALLDKCEGVSYSKLLGKFVLDLAESDTSIVAVTAAMGEATEMCIRDRQILVLQSLTYPNNIA